MPNAEYEDEEERKETDDNVRARLTTTGTLFWSGTGKRLSISERRRLVWNGNSGNGDTVFMA